MKIPSVSCLYLIALFFSWNVSAQQPSITPVSLNKIGNNLYEVAGGSGAIGGAFIGNRGVLLIDAKMNQESVKQTISEIRKLTDKPILFLVNTHSDGDHVNGNRFFPESVVFVAHENCRKEFFHPGRNGEPSSWNVPELAPYIPSVTFTSKMDLYVDESKTELWYFGKGHTTGDIVVFFPDERIAFVGDQVFKGRAQLIHSYKGGNSFDHVSTLEKMLETLDAEKFYSGHSEALNRDEIREHIEEMKELQNRVAGFVKNNFDLKRIRNEFNKDLGNLVESIYNEIIAAK